MKGRNPATCSSSMNRILSLLLTGGEVTSSLKGLFWKRKQEDGETEVMDESMPSKASRTAAHMSSAIVTARGNCQLLRGSKSVVYGCSLLASGAHSREAHTSENIQAAQTGLDGWESMPRSTRSWVGKGSNGGSGKSMEKVHRIKTL